LLYSKHLGLLSNFYEAVQLLTQYGVHLAPNPDRPGEWHVVSADEFKLENDRAEKARIVGVIEAHERDRVEATENIVTIQGEPK
jgi:hypothetical protein